MAVKAEIFGIWSLIVEQLPEILLKVMQPKLQDCIAVQWTKGMHG